MKSTEVQGYLWDDLGNHGHVRTVVGALAERLTAKLVGGKIHKTDSTADYCPDVSVNGTYFESKAVGRSNQAFVYGGRLEKDRAFATSHRLVYVIWNHAADSKVVSSITDLERLVLSTMRRLYVVPFAAIDRVCAGMTPDKLNSKYGGSSDRPEYGSGFRISLSLLDRWVHRRYEDGYGEEGVSAAV